MQISASTLLASQQVGQAQAKPAAGFAQALEKASGFQPLPLKQVAAAEDASKSVPQPAPNKPQKVGSMVDIKI
jgi:hypothetical protein